MPLGVAVGGPSRVFFESSCAFENLSFLFCNTADAEWRNLLPNRSTQSPSETAVPHDIVKRFHDHGILGAEQATAFRTGVLDAELLRDLKMQRTEFDGCTVVSVKFQAMTRNFPVNRVEPVFAVHTASGQLLGGYFASAFKSLHV